VPISCLANSATLEKEAKISAETFANFHRSTQLYVPEERNFHNHACENLKYFTDHFQASFFEIYFTSNDSLIHPTSSLNFY
jgi:hypothetical protein